MNARRVGNVVTVAPNSHDSRPAGDRIPTKNARLMVSSMIDLVCPKCGAHYSADVRRQVCPVEGAPLLVTYDFERAAKTMTKAALATRVPSMWRYTELLPLRLPERRVSLGETMTPIVPLPRLSQKYGITLTLKDESLLPTGSFKARGAAVGVSRARELGVTELAMPTNGNAGGAWGAYAARAGIRAHVIIPQGAPAVNRLEAVMTGADVRLIDGLISDAGRVVAREVAEYGWYDASTLKEPYRIEGKKTIGLELAEQFGWDVPDAIVYPTGGGVGLIGIDKALRELQMMGLIGPRMPKMIAVQASGCAPIVKAFNEGASESTMWPNAHSVAFGVNVPKALGDFLVLDSIARTHGAAVAVDDDELLDRQREIAAAEGVFVCPEGGAVLAGALALLRDGIIARGERVLLINTATGLKYPDIPYPMPPFVRG